jgi:hypothetical protein
MLTSLRTFATSLALVALSLQFRSGRAQVFALPSLDDHTRTHDVQRRFQEIAQRRVARLDPGCAYTFKLRETIDADQHQSRVKLWAPHPCKDAALPISDYNVIVDGKVMTITGVAVGNRFARTYTLPDHIVPENVTATYTKDNVLRITCPIHPPTAPSPRNIEIFFEEDPQSAPETIKTDAATADAQSPSVQVSSFAAPTQVRLQQREMQKRLAQQQKPDAELQTQQHRQQQQEREQRRTQQQIQQQHTREQQHAQQQKREQVQDTKQKQQSKVQKPKPKQTTTPPSASSTKVKRDKHTRKDYVHPPTPPCTGINSQNSAISSTLLDTVIWFLKLIQMISSGRYCKHNWQTTPTPTPPSTKDGDDEVVVFVDQESSGARNSSSSQAAASVDAVLSKQGPLDVEAYIKAVEDDLARIKGMVY